MIETKKYKKILAQSLQRRLSCPARCSLNWCGCIARCRRSKGRSGSAACAPGHGRVQSQSVRSVIRDLCRRAVSLEEVLMNIAGAPPRTTCSKFRRRLPLAEPRVPCSGWSVSPPSSWYSASVLTFQVSNEPRPRMFRAARRAVIIEWSWLLYLCMPLRPASSRLASVSEPAADHGQVGLVLRRRRPGRPWASGRRSRRPPRPAEPGRSHRSRAGRAR